MFQSLQSRLPGGTNPPCASRTSTHLPMHASHICAAAPATSLAPLIARFVKKPGRREFSSPDGAERNPGPLLRIAPIGRPRIALRFIRATGYGNAASARREIGLVLL